MKISNMRAHITLDVFSVVPLYQAMLPFLEKSADLVGYYWHWDWVLRDVWITKNPKFEKIAVHNREGIIPADVIEIR